MKKVAFILLLIVLSIAAKAQKINQDTLAKYSKKEEQLKVFNVIANDIHLGIGQREPFNRLSLDYASQALAVIGNKNADRSEKLSALKKIGTDYMDHLKTILSPAQIDLLKDERSKYHFGKRFLKQN